MSFAEHAPYAKALVDQIATLNPLQGKAIEKFVATQDATYWSFAEAVCRTLSERFLRGEAERATVARAYNQLCRELNAEQFYFKKTGVYRTQDAKDAERDVYSQAERMRTYCLGLMVSHLFWKSHWEMLRLLQRHLEARTVGRCLEVGVGHGLLAHEVLSRFPDAQLTALDISRASLDLARDILASFDVDLSRVEFVQQDFLAPPADAQRFDLVVMGEVLEHVNTPAEFLRQARARLAPGGTMYLSTCANCPAADHVYLFKSVREIRDMITGAGLHIVEDLALPLEESVPPELWEAKRVNVNYAAIVAAAVD